MNIFKQNKNSYILNSNSHLNDNLDKLLDMNKSQGMSLAVLYIPQHKLFENLYKYQTRRLILGVVVPKQYMRV